MFIDSRFAEICIIQLFWADPSHIWCRQQKRRIPPFPPFPFLSIFPHSHVLCVIHVQASVGQLSLRHSACEFVNKTASSRRWLVVRRSFHFKLMFLCSVAPTGRRRCLSLRTFVTLISVSARNFCRKSRGRRAGSPSRGGLLCWLIMCDEGTSSRGPFSTDTVSL